ncbi:hypothetical protein TWF481_000124 [Arthrobotrys musiformis]|uniref:Uncharacterized protein n=1 Tax=Arthrobotrys musiformis TaxID=47236 RepID=A0AAV9WLQ3_9PEZI
MERQLPLPYKIVIIRKESEEWLLAHTSIFDCAEPPRLPTLGQNDLEIKDSRFQLAVYSTACLVFIEQVLEKINASPALEGTGCKYCIFGADTANLDGRWEKICIILKLANCNDTFRAVVGEPGYSRVCQAEEEELSHAFEQSRLETPVPSEASVPSVPVPA